MGNTPTKLTVKDISLDDKKIPRNLILKYGDSYYVMKAGLEWKANKLWGGAGYSLVLKCILRDFGEKMFIFKATLRVLANGATFVNYGEAHSKNANSMLQDQLFHLAATRAECRVLRMATACGYASYDEVKTMNGNGGAGTTQTPTIEGGDRPITPAQEATIKALSGEINKNMNKQDAANTIRNLATKKNEK